jgi:hypothetical protein
MPLKPWQELRNNIPKDNYDYYKKYHKMINILYDDYYKQKIIIESYLLENNK